LSLFSSDRRFVMSYVVRTGNGRDFSGETGRDFTTYATLLGKAHEESITRIRTELIQTPDDGNHQTAIVKAEVETSRGTFQALGDASPENVEEFLAPHLIRVAETRAKARALRDAVNVGVVSLEELDGRGSPGTHPPRSGAGPGNGSPHSEAPRSPVRLNGPVATSAFPPDTSQMSEGQRRYLFRLMAGRGMKGEAAHEALKSYFRVDNLAHVSKVDATRAIDQFLSEAGQGNGHGITQH
jgi:hypothetical protein